MFDARILGRIVLSPAVDDLLSAFIPPGDMRTQKKSIRDSSRMLAKFLPDQSTSCVPREIVSRVQCLPGENQ